jgi:hypothetical protein
MFLGVILYCFIPTDAFSCSMMARTGGLFHTREQCQITVTQEMIVLGERIKALTRAKCFEVGQSA